MPVPTPHAVLKALQRHWPAGIPAAPGLDAALDHLRARPSKLFRARLLLATAAALDVPAEPALQLACALEFFHLASLILDDLPCMDDAVVRRGQACVHRRHGEAVAILAALALINRGYRLVHLAFAGQPRAVRDAASTLLDHSLGVAGLIGGQARDLAFGSVGSSPREIGRIAVAKTGTLLGLALRLPALAARAGREECHALRMLALYWGLAFQIADDLSDVLGSNISTGKSTGRDLSKMRPNLALALGVAPARARLARLAGRAVTVLARLARDGRGRWGGLEAINREVFAIPVSTADSTAA